jgi:hypothetical protein
MTVTDVSIRATPTESDSIADESIASIICRRARLLKPDAALGYPSTPQREQHSWRLVGCHLGQ